MTTTDVTVCAVPECRTATRSRLTLPGVGETAVCPGHWRFEVLGGE